jgi:hypothetical protein
MPVYTGQRGYISAQPKIGQGIVDSVFAGENAIHEPDGWRVFNGWRQIDGARTVPTLGYTATLTAGSHIAALSGGATALTDFRAFQHVLIGRKLFVLEAIPDNTHLQISPTPDASEAGAGQAIKKVPALSALNLDRATLLAGNAIRFKEQAIYAIGDGGLFLNGSAISAALAASENLKVAYPNPGGGFTVTNAGFTKPAALAATELVGGGTKGMPTGTYWVAVARKRAGFSGLGNPSDRVPVVINTVGNRIRIPLGAFDSSQGQTAWVILVSRIDERAKDRPGLWRYIVEPAVQSVNFDFDFYDEELQERASYDNDPPPKALFTFSLGNHLAVASSGGPPDGSGISTTPGAEVAAAKSSNPEAFSPFARTPTQGGEVIVGVHAGELVAFLLTPNTLQVCSLTGNTINPFAIRRRWGAGFAHQYCGVIANDLFYGLTKTGLYRTIGKDAFAATGEFAMRVRPDFRGIKPGRGFVGSDTGKKHVVVFVSNARLGSGGGWQTKALVYNTETDAWSAPAYLGNGTADFVVTNCATVGNDLYFTTADGFVWRWDDPDAGLTLVGFVGFPFVADNARWYKTVRSAKLTGNANGELAIYTELDEDGLKSGGGDAPTFPLSGGGTGVAVHQDEWDPSLLCSSYALRASFELPGGAEIFESLEADHIVHEGWSK